MAEKGGLKEEIRVAFRYQSVNVPGAATERAQKVANDFALTHFQRPFTYTTDFIHLPSDFDSSERKNIWILCDFNIQWPINQVEEVPLQCWKITYRMEQQP